MSKMPICPRAVFFDVDGVLVDSLPQHLQICRDKAVEFGLKLKIPTVDEFRQLVRRGTKVSPMRYFFLAVGFPEDYAARAVADYEREFIQRYRPKAFPGVSKMLKTLQAAEVKLGLVTSNTRANVVPALGNAMQYFEERAAFSSLTDIRNQKRSHGALPKARAYLGWTLELACTSGTNLPMRMQRAKLAFAFSALHTDGALKMINNMRLRKASLKFSTS
jgi:phosphoglycolate phosphatase-like HAD superfamily hydrolase